MSRATRRFFARDPVAMAKRLIGCTLVRMIEGERLAGRIVETEAYCGPEDQAAHSRNGHRSPRVESMYGPPGTLYVYFTYGMHHCTNVVCGKKDEPVAVLLRAIEPVDGLATIRARREGGVVRKHPLRDRDLTSGPARLCTALGIDRALDGVDLVESEQVWIEPGPAVSVSRLVNTPRIGIGSGGAWAAKALRWYLDGNAHVSKR